MVYAWESIKWYFYIVFIASTIVAVGLSIWYSVYLKIGSNHTLEDD
jgi:hypothetical protein